MKVAIVDDLVLRVLQMKQAVEEAGHEAFPVHVGDEPKYEEQRFGRHLKDLSEIVAAVRQFSPDVLLIDHCLAGDAMTGGMVVVALGLPHVRLIGTSSLPQPYCREQFQGKDFLNKEEERQNLARMIFGP